MRDCFLNKIIINRCFILFLFSLLCYSCKDDGCNDNGELTDSELTWMPYSNGQKLVFKNDSLGSDTITVNVIRFDFDFICPTSNCRKSEAIQAKFQLDSAEFLLSVAHYISCPKVEDGTVIYWGSRRDFIRDHNDSITIGINGTSYSNVRLLMENLSIPDNGNIYYSKTKGILSYQLNDGSIWTLAN